MKKGWMLVFTFFTAVSLFGAAQYEFDPGEPGRRNGSLNILENLSSLTLYSNFGSIGNSGSVGYYVYTDNPADAVTGAVTFSKSNGAIILPELQAGDKVGFYLKRRNGRIIRDFYFVPHGDSYFLAFEKNGHGNDEVMFFSSIVSETVPLPSGQPLPGLLVSLLIGIAAFLIYRRHKPVRRRTV